jgi:hypothetical protein
MNTAAFTNYDVVVHYLTRGGNERTQRVFVAARSRAQAADVAIGTVCGVNEPRYGRRAIAGTEVYPETIAPR